MRYHHLALADLQRRSTHHAELERQLEKLKAKKQEIDDQIVAERDRSRQQAEAMIATWLDPGNTGFRDAVERLLRVAVTPLFRAKEAIQQEQESTKEIIASLPPPPQAASYIERAARWDSLGVAEQNRLLGLLVDEIKVVGEPPHERLELRLRFPGERSLSPVPLFTKISSNGKYTRRLPEVEDWQYVQGYLRCTIGLPGLKGAGRCGVARTA
jgi:hypothetical protein